MPKKQTELPVESSWRMVEGGENDSFDTSIVHDTYEDDLILSSGPSQPSQPSQPSSASQGFSDGSQDSISHYTNRADDDRLITRVPFQPSLANTRRASTESTPVPQFRWPRVDVSPTHSVVHSRTVRRVVESPQPPTRRRGYQGQASSPQKQSSTAARRFQDEYDEDEPSARRPQRPTPSQRFSNAAPDFF